MALNKNEKKYLAEMVRKDLEHFRKTEQSLIGVDVSFLKAEHKFDDFLADLLKKLED